MNKSYIWVYLVFIVDLMFFFFFDLYNRMVNGCLSIGVNLYMYMCVFCYFLIVVSICIFNLKSKSCRYCSCLPSFSYQGDNNARCSDVLPCHNESLIWPKKDNQQSAERAHTKRIDKKINWTFSH